MISPRPCTYCAGMHTSLMCQKKPRKPLKTKKAVKKLGSKSVKWLKFRKRYLSNHPPNTEGYYTCYLCKRWVKPGEVTLDHVRSRSRHPDLVFEEDNIRLCCWDCNTEKGSLDLEEFKEKANGRN